MTDEPLVPWKEIAARSIDRTEALEDAIEQTWRPEVKALRDENERLKREVDYWVSLDAQALEAENERLKSELGEVTDLYTTYRGLVHDGVQVADVIKSIRGQMAALRISERAWVDQNERLRITINDLVALIKNVDADANNVQLDIAKVLRQHRLDA